MSGPFVIGLDIGGTFTDCVVLDSDSGAAYTGKAPSTPPSFARGFFDAIADGARAVGTDVADLLAQTSVIVHGSTVATNALVARTGADVGLLTTAGFGETLAIMKGGGRSAGLSAEHVLHAAATSKPEPIVQTRMIREVPERIDRNGSVIMELDEEACAEAVRELVAEGCGAIAISFLWSFLDDRHERRAEAIAREVAPGLPVSRSSAIAPRIGEYERTVSTAVNAYAAPSLDRYMGNLRAEAQKLADCPPILFMQCNGGIATSERILDVPILTLHSGPVAGVASTRELGALLERPHIIATDMGGTTFDAAVVRGGELPVRDTMIVNQFEMFLPAIDVQSIGAGGGSVIWVDEVSGSLRVGPQSAGADPGPVAYGQGGTQPTITDADVVLGYLDADAFLGGRKRLDAEAAHAALARVGEPLGLDALQVAAGAKLIVDSKMADLIRKMTIERGYDPRDFTLVAYGGGGPTHAAGYARDLGIEEVVIPFGDQSSVWSASGLCTADIRHVLDAVELQDAPLDGARLTDAYERLERDGRELLQSAGIDAALWRLERVAGLRYKAQVHDVTVTLPPGRLDEAALSDAIARFERKYEEIYGRGAAHREAGIELAMVRVVASAARGKVGGGPTVRRSASTNGHHPEPTIRDVYWGAHRGFLPTPIHRGAQLAPGFETSGPTVVELDNTTIVVEPGERLRLAEHGSFVLTIPAAG
ncbi:hydantoinase/oxoprolinase family protein [Conexibacter sp. CPCC 206217]|uniref:hydantoinase/oxoprolinase family protein n=1 Tax=Conexibacter sp. CPCC 206217 TaxID=3064574 RepID=UPI0027256EE0|nr:hydantoinase/oxoprolinase family protein [Conexibacter sp. CPCC 206217]MDO8211096.1 hydantoinase/oxoprolinase family protein [Conexibacter sp. CPCC 206217]